MNNLSRVDFIKQLRGRLYFTISDVAGLLGIKRNSAKLLCYRYVKKGVFLRLKNNYYVLEEAWARFSKNDFFKTANFLQVPSYISFTSALAFYEVTTQVSVNYFENASVKRTAMFEADGAVFRYFKIKKEYYSDFIKMNGFFIATKEKAFLDALYLDAFGKYSLDVDALDLSKIDTRKVMALIKKYPQKIQKIAKKLCKTS